MHLTAGIASASRSVRGDALTPHWDAATELEALLTLDDNELEARLLILDDVLLALLSADELDSLWLTAELEAGVLGVAEPLPPEPPPQALNVNAAARDKVTFTFMGLPYCSLLSISHASRNRFHRKATSIAA